MQEVAGTIKTKLISGGYTDILINDWLSKNADVEVIDIKFAASANDDDWGTDALIIYRKEN